GSLVAQYSGGSVAKVAHPPLTPLGSHLTAVDCRSTTWCVAVGETHASALVVQLRGTTWSIPNTPTPGAGYDTLTSVSCPTTTWCMAVGYATRANGVPTAIALWFHAGKWQKVTMALAGQAPEPDAVSCPSTSWCEAVGGSNGVAGAAVSQFTGGKWVKATPPTGVPGALVSVDCVATQWCVTVSNNGGGGRFATLEASGAVRASAAALHSPDTFSQLSCWARAGCVAVGHDSSRSYGVGSPLADAWTGGAWVARELPALTY
ncbi:MAG TPA: hypothetical protein VGS61_02255, partial [Acidimicrobiales bacterium]|nr:hypothetical protein [Acidimicrobiales bacterium]